jgi:hypothetical protein
MRNSDSPKKLPPMLVAIWSFIDGAVVSPAISHSTLPPTVYPSDSQKDRPADRAKPWYIAP